MKIKTLRKFLTLAFCMGLLAAFAVGAAAAGVQQADGSWHFQGIAVTEDGELDEDFVREDVDTVENGAVFPAYYIFEDTTAIRVIENFSDYNIYAAQAETGWLYSKYNGVQLSDGTSFEPADVTIYAVVADEDDADGGYALVYAERISRGDRLIYMTDGGDVVYVILADESVGTVQDLYAAILADQENQTRTAVDAEITAAIYDSTAGTWTVTLSEALPDDYAVQVSADGTVAEAAAEVNSDGTLTITVTAAESVTVLSIADSSGTYRTLITAVPLAAETEDAAA